MMQPEEKVLHDVGPELEVIPGNLEEGIARRKRNLKLAAIAGGIGLLVLSAIGIGGGWYYMDSYLPQEASARVDAAPWKTLDADEMAFKSPEDFTRAEKNLVSLANLPANAKNPIPDFLLGNLYYAQGRDMDALVSYKKSRRMIENDWHSKAEFKNYNNEISEDLVIIYYENNKPQQALDELASINIDKAIHGEYLQAVKDSLEEPRRGDFHLVLGKKLQEYLRIDLARQEIEQAARLTTDPTTRMEARGILSRMPRHTQDLTPLARYFSTAAQMEESEENLKQAADFYELSIKETPGFEWSHNELAIVYRQMQDYSRASNYARQAIQLNPKFYTPYLTLGDIALDQKDFKSAISQYSRAQQLLKQHPQTSDAIATEANIENQLGYAYEKLEDSKKAIDHYRQAMRKSSQAGEADDAVADSDELDAEYAYAQEGLERLKP